MGIKPIITVLLFLFFCTNNNCVAQSYLLSPFSFEQELSSRQITCFFQDKKGFMWIGTGDGLNFYNANSIKIFKHDVKNENSISNNYIQNICEDGDGNLWIGTATGVDRYSPSLNIFTHFTGDDKKNSFGYKNKVYADRLGNIWAGNQGLYKFDVAKQKFNKITNPYSDALFGSHLANVITGFFQDSRKNYWVGTADGLFLYNDANKSFARFDTPPSSDNYKKFGIIYKSVYEDEDGNLFTGTWDYGVFKILPGQKKLIPIGEKGVILCCTSQKLNGKKILWCPGQALTGYDENDEISVRLDNKIDDPFSLRRDDINTLFTDKQGQLWIGFASEGIQILSPGNQLIKAFKISGYADKHKIASVTSILKKNNSIYVGGWYGDAVCKLDTNNTVLQWWPTLPLGDEHGNNVSDFYADKSGNIWLPGHDGIVCMNEKSGTIKNYKYDSITNTNNRFLKILPEGDSVLWLAGYDNGLTRFSLRTRRLQMIGSKNSRSLYWKIVFDKSGNIWCANNNGCLDKFETGKKIFTTYKFDTLTEQSIYYDLAYDSSSNNLWVASTNGLLVVNAATQHAQLFTEKDGLPTSSINLLAQDKKKRLWIGTSKGLSMYDAVSNSFRNFYTNNGLSTEKIDHSLSVGEDGKLYIGADNSFMIMDINSLTNNTDISPVYINIVSEDGNILQPHFKNGKSVIDISYNENSLWFEFAMADLLNPEDNELLYQLQGWDKNFIQTKKGEVIYNKLPPGTYVFKVKGINHAGIKNETGDEITIIIHPPFWKTWWFITLISAAVLIVFAFAVRYISQRNLKEKLLMLEKEQAVDKERNRISKDMHDDLGSGLTKIAIMSEVVKKQINEPDKARQQLDNISASSRELVDSLQDIIWILNPKNDTLENLAAYIREYGSKFFEPFGIEVEFNYPENFADVKLSEETRRNIFLTIKETFNNIAKHAWCNNVEVKIISAGNEINFLIRDDGKGFETENVNRFGNGLINMKNRIELIGGKYNVKSMLNKGTVTDIQIFI